MAELAAGSTTQYPIINHVDFSGLHNPTTTPRPHPPTPEHIGISPPHLARVRPQPTEHIGAGAPPSHPPNRHRGRNATPLGVALPRPGTSPCCSSGSSTFPARRQLLHLPGGVGGRPSASPP
ncbi:hypothetical protein SORBI_3005G225300 [Sorghum bicolor]|uniref:Uncharacterized protein n=1 Tax=Sorghum bicolor TaxID=4558 RepID=A0A1B6PU48_SORBI|nr:hypothetical protein SORBI_3005G225300 [Sorghum bicolor]